MAREVILIASLFITFCLMPNVQSINDEYYNLVEYLFEGYDPNIRPASNDTTATQASVQMFLTSIIDLDELNQILIASVILDISYSDIYLTWTPSDYSGITHMVYKQENVWLPDIVVENSIDSLKQLGYKTMPLTVYYDGTVTWQPKEVIRTACDIDVTFYPFDTQTCQIILTTWASFKSDIDIDMDILDDGKIELEYYGESGTWELVSTNIAELPTQNNLTRLSFSITLKRRRTWYILNLLVPVVALSLTASMVFALPADAGEKMGMSITVLLAYAVYLTIISESMPKTSLQISVVGIYLNLLLVATAMAVVLSTIVLSLHHHPEEQPVGWRTRKCVVCARSFLCISKYKSEGRSEDSRSETGSQSIFVSGDSDKKHLSPLRRNNRVFVTSSDIGLQDTPTRNGGTKNLEDPLANDRSERTEEEEVTWKEVAFTLDRCLFYLFSLFIIFITIICIGYMALAAP